MTIPTYRLPDRLARGSEFGPERKVTINPGKSGVETRQRQWSNSRLRGDVGVGLRSILDVTDQLNYVHQVIAMFEAHEGSTLPFRVRVPMAQYNKATDAWFGEGDGSTTQFQLGKKFDPLFLMTGAAGTRTYFKPIYLLEGTPTIKKDGFTQTVTTHYTISSTMLVTFVTAPAEGLALTWSSDPSGGIDLAFRFDTEYLAVRFPYSKRNAEIGSIPIVELFGAHEITG